MQMRIFIHINNKLALDAPLFLSCTHIFLLLLLFSKWMIHMRKRFSVSLSHQLAVGMCAKRERERAIDASVFSENLNNYKIIHAISLKSKNASEQQHHHYTSNKQHGRQRQSEMNAFRLLRCTWLLYLTATHTTVRSHTFQSNRTSTFFFLQFITSTNSKQQAFASSRVSVSKCVFVLVCVFLFLYHQFIVCWMRSGRSVASWMRVQCEWIKCLISIYKL